MNLDCHSAKRVFAMTMSEKVDRATLATRHL